MADTNLEFQNISGKSHPTYNSVLNRAHQGNTEPSMRYVGLEETLIQAPNASNDQTAIVHAKLSFLDEQTGDVRTFSSIGDANPANCNSMVAKAIIRMASTRAKGRAMREALNIAEALAEELAEGSATASSSPGGGSKPAQSSSSSTQAAAPASANGEPDYAKGWDGVMRFGKNKGKHIRDIDTDDLQWLLDKEILKFQDGKPNEDQRGKVRAEIERRANGGGTTQEAAPAAASTASGWKPSSSDISELIKLGKAKGLTYVDIKNMAEAEFGNNDPKGLTEDEFDTLKALLA